MTASRRPAGTAARIDQAHGLRQLFAGRGERVLAIAANPFVDRSGAVLDRVASTIAAHGRSVLVVDAASNSPQPHELARIDLAACVERIAPRVAYVAASGLPMRHVDTRGSAAAFVDALRAASPDSDTLLLHADGGDLARLLKARAVRPLLLGADHPEAIKHAYANCKLLVGRCGLMTYDLLLAASPRSPRVAAIAASVGSCADNFLGAAVIDWALIDPDADPASATDPTLTRLLAAQLDIDDCEQTPLGVIADAHAAPPHRPAFR